LISGWARGRFRTRGSATVVSDIQSLLAGRSIDIGARSDGSDDSADE
jgi:hypothetical protein